MVKSMSNPLRPHPVQVPAGVKIVCDENCPTYVDFTQDLLPLCSCGSQCGLYQRLCQMVGSVKMPNPVQQGVGKSHHIGTICKGKPHQLQYLGLPTLPQQRLHSLLCLHSLQCLHSLLHHTQIAQLIPNGTSIPTCLGIWVPLPCSSPLPLAILCHHRLYHLVTTSVYCTYFYSTLGLQVEQTHNCLLCL